MRMMTRILGKCSSTRKMKAIVEGRIARSLKQVGSSAGYRRVSVIALVDGE